MTTKPKLVEIPDEHPDWSIDEGMNKIYLAYGKSLDPTDPYVWLDALEKYPKPNVLEILKHHFLHPDGSPVKAPPKLQQILADLDKRGYAEFIWASRQVANEAQKRSVDSGPATAEEAWNISTEAMLMAGLITLEQAKKMMKMRSH